MADDYKPTPFDIIAVELGGTVTKHMDAVRIVEALAKRGYMIVPVGKSADFHLPNDAPAYAALDAVTDGIVAEGVTLPYWLMPSGGGLIRELRVRSSAVRNDQRRRFRIYLYQGDAEAAAGDNSHFELPRPIYSLLGYIDADAAAIDADDKTGWIEGINLVYRAEKISWALQTLLPFTPDSQEQLIIEVHPMPLELSETVGDAR